MPRFLSPYLLNQNFSFVLGETKGIVPLKKFTIEVQRCFPSMHVRNSAPVSKSIVLAKMIGGTKKFCRQ